MSRVALRCALAIAVVLTACAAPPRRPLFSGAVRELEGVNCPEDRVRVVEWRQSDGDTFYVLDACGTKLEVVNRLVLPTKRSEVIEMSSENPDDDSSDRGSPVRDGTVAIVRQKVQSWCVTRAPVDQDAIAFVTANPTECRAHLVDVLVPVRTERDEQTGEISHWFCLG